MRTPSASGPSLLLATLLLAACRGDDAALDGGPAPQPPSRPNVVLVLADDLGRGDVGAYGFSDAVPTPHLDRVAAEGLRLTDAHSPSAVCTPTRYGLLTGRYAWRTRLKSWTFNGYGTALIEPDRRTLADLFADHGYATAGFGKWHLGLGSGERTDYAAPLVPGPRQAGFERYVGIPASLDFEPYVWVVDEGLEAPPSESVEGSRQRRAGGEGFWRAGRAAPGFRHDQVLPRIADEACAWLAGREAAAEAGDRRPFFLYVPLSAPHTPWLPTGEHVGASAAGPYGDFVTQVDAAVGSIVDQLERQGLLDETLLIVTSDNGAHWTPADLERWPHAANGPVRGQKADVFEGGHRVPFLVRWPGQVPAGAVRDELFSLTDVYASLAHLMGDEPAEAEAEDSVDQLDLWRGAQFDEPPRVEMVQHSGAGLFAVRSGDWKLVLGLGSGGFTAPRTVEPEPGGPEGQLYHLGDDPLESTNLWLERPDVVARLTAALEEWQRSGRSR